MAFASMGLRKFEFLELPLEIRDQIYNYLLLYWDPGCEYDDESLKSYSFAEIHLLNLLNHKQQTPKGYDLHIAIMKTNRQIHDEAARILYGNNFFKWQATQGDARGLYNHTNCLAQDLPMRYIRLIRRMRLEFICLYKPHLSPYKLCAAMERTARDTVDTIKNNQLKKLVVIHKFNETTRQLASKYSWFMHLLPVEVRNKLGFGETVLAPFCDLRGVRKAIVRGLPTVRREAVINLVQKMQRPRSEEEEGECWKGWARMGELGWYKWSDLSWKAQEDFLNGKYN
jgi:hypothetical protein